MKRISILFSFIFIASLVQAQWSTATLSQARSNLSAASVGTKVFFAGGGYSSGISSRVDIYDNATGTWSMDSLSQARGYLSATSVGNKVFFAGGYVGSTVSNRVDIYDNATGTWSTDSLSQARSYLSAASAGTKVFFAGGFDNANVRSNRVDIYDNATGTWSADSLSLARSMLSAASVGTKVFFAGGYDNANNKSNRVDIYDNATGTWSTTTLPHARYGLVATSVGTKAFFAGGQANNVSDIVDIYDNATGTWSTDSLSLARTNLCAVSLGTKVFVAGGDGNFGPSGVIDIYDNATGIWSTDSLSLARSMLSAASVGNKVFFAGGGSETLNLNGINIVDIYTFPPPSITSFTPTTGAPGTVVTLTGNFDPTPTSNLVTFNGVSATVTASSYTSLTTTVPAGASTGPIGISYLGLSATSSSNFSVTGSTAQTITFAALVAKTYGNTPFALTATASSGLPVSYSCNCPGVATLSGTNNNTVTIVGAGTCDITASQAGNATYSAAPNKMRTLTVNKANQTITFATLVAKNFLSIDFALTATTTSGLPITYTSSDSTVAIIYNGNMVDVVGVGTSTIRALQPGNNNYNAATTVARTQTVNKANQTITFATPPTQTFDARFYRLTATSSTGLPITYTSATTTVATISLDTAIFIGVGTSSITAMQAGNANFNPASLARTLTINKGNQTITFGTLPAVNSYDPNFNLTATASSGLFVTYTSSNTAVATVSDVDGDNIWTVDILAPGTTNITAKQLGNGKWNAATNVMRPLLVKALQTITFNPLPNKNLGDAPFRLSATASSGLPVTYASSDPSIATIISGDSVAIVGPGTVTITASQAGNGAFSPAPDVQRSLFVGLLAPTVSASFIEFANVTASSMRIGFIPGNGNRHLVVIKPFDPSNFFTPVNDVFYNAGFTSNGSTVVASIGVGDSVTATGLLPSTKYFVKVFTFNQAGAFTSYLTGCEPNAAQTTLNSGGGAGSRVATNSTVSSTSEAPKKDYTIKAFDVKVLGNPFDKKLTFVVDSEQNDAIITLTDLTGRTVHSSTVITNSTVEIEKPISQGVYLLKVKSGVDSKTIRVIKVSE